MATRASIDGNFKHRYGPWIDPLPDLHTLADLAPFVPQEERPGKDYAFAVLTGISHGQTANVDGSAFAINTGIDTQITQAVLVGATILLTETVSYDVIFESLNGNGNGNEGGSYKTALDILVKSMMQGAGLYRELALAFGPGTGTACASNIGVISTTAAGALSTARTVRLTEASWINGLWFLMQNALVDLYQADATTSRETSVQVQGVVDPSKTSITLFKAASGNTPTATDIIVPIGWRTKSCYGIEAIYNNAGTLFGISAATVAPWRCRVFNAGGALTRSKILGYAAKIALYGVRDGGVLQVDSSSFADLAEEASALQRFTANTDKVKRQGASQLTYETAAGVISVEVYQYQKQGQAWFIANDNMKRVGSTDLTMRPIGGGAQGFFTHLPSNAGASMRVFGNQAPVFEMPFRNFLVTGVVSPNRTVDS